MNEQNLDINLIMQAFQEKVSQLITELVVKEAIAKVNKATSASKTAASKAKKTTKK